MKKNSHILDWNASVEIYNGNEKMTRELLAIFVKELCITEKTLNNAFTSNDYDALRSELHRVLGSIYYMKAPELEESLIAFQEAVNAKPINEAEYQKLFKVLQNAIQNFKSTYKSFSVHDKMSFRLRKTF